MTGDEVREVFEAIWPQEEIERLCQQLGVIERQRQLNLGMFVRAMVMSAGTPGGAYQADVLRSYLECEVPHVARAALYRWFDPPLERFMAALAERALAYARAQTVTGRDPLRAECPGTGEDAALTVHQVLSVGCGAPVRDHVSPAREHDSRHLTIDASWQGDGLLADLAYASLARLRACETPDVRFVMRLQENWQPQVDDVARGQITQAFFPGTAFDALLADDTRVLEGRAIDADVPIGRGRQALPLRLVGIQTPKGDGFFLTNVPPRIGPRQVADLYRGRWEVELSIRLDTSVNRLDAIDTERPCSLKTLLHASLIASTMAALLAHTHHVQTRPQEAGAPRTEAPLHPRRLALQLAVSCQSMAQVFELTEAEATQRGNKIAAWLTQSGKDPNWRRRPSVLDQLRGWKRQPLARKQGHNGDVSQRNFKTAASVDTYGLTTLKCSTTADGSIRISVTSVPMTMKPSLSWLNSVSVFP
jgi:hypothetical protein